MANNSTDGAVQRALKAALLVIGDPKRQANLQDEVAFAESLKKLGLPQTETARKGLLDIINRVEQAASARPSTPPGTETRASRPDIEKMLLESFVHIRWSFWISLAMSVILFVVGLIFVGTALARSLNEGAVSTATLTIAGLGIADFVLLFYTRPWQDIAVNLSNSQQVKIIATSYLVGIALLDEGSPNAFGLLEQLTRYSVGLLEEFTEERSTVSATAPSSEEPA